MKDNHIPDDTKMVSGVKDSLTTQQEQGEPVEIDLATMELAESVGLIGPSSRADDLHMAIQRFHDLICVNTTIKAAQMAADAIREAAASRVWVGLTKEQKAIFSIGLDTIPCETVINDIEAVLRANNTQTQPQQEQGETSNESAMAELLGTDVETYRRFKDWQRKQEQRKCDNRGEFGECCQQPKQEQELDPVHEYRKGFIAGQIDMRDRPEEQGDPVAWRISYPNEPELGFWFAEGIGGEGCLNEPLYTTPQQRKPLTDEQIGDQFVRFQVGGMFTPFLYAVRAIEAAHGIKENT